MRKIAFVLLGIATAIGAVAQVTKPIRYDSFKFGKAYYHIAIADLSTQQVSIETVLSRKLTPAAQLARQNETTVALTGTFFDPSTGYPVGDVLVDGNLMAKGQRGSVLAINWQGIPHIFDSGFQSMVDWTDYRFALRGAVRIITAGKVSPNPKAQKFRDSRIWSRASRTAAGITEDGRLILAATKGNVTLSELGKALRTRTVVDAISLDGGGSTFFMYRGKTLIQPNRRLSNLLVLKESSDTMAGLPGWVQVSGWVARR